MSDKETRIDRAFVKEAEYKGETTYLIASTNEKGQEIGLWQMMDCEYSNGFEPVWTNRLEFCWHNASKRHVIEQLELIKSLHGEKR